MLCPHCQANGISAWNKYWSGSASPALCSACGEPSYIPTRYVTYGNFLEYTVGVIALAAAIYTSSLLPLAAIVLTVVLVEWGVLHYAPLRAVTHEDIRENKRWGNLFLILIVVLVALAAFWEH